MMEKLRSRLVYGRERFRWQMDELGRSMLRGRLVMAPVYAMTAVS